MCMGWYVCGVERIDLGNRVMHMGWDTAIHVRIDNTLLYDDES